MPNDATHRIVNYLILVMFIVLNFYISLENDFIIIMIFIGSYILGTEIFSPDLDTHSKPSRRLGMLSYPIRKLSRHRGLGHNILIGWLLKVFYIFSICFTILSVALIIVDKFSYIGYDDHSILRYIANIYIDIDVMMALLAGLFLSNAVHIMTDKIL